MNLVITGATSGIGKETVKALVARCDQIFLLVRNIEKGKAVVDQFKNDTAAFHVIYCDLADLATVVTASESVKKQARHIDVLINNAGGIYESRILTKDDLEMSFSTNHLGHFLLTHNILPLLKNAGTSRVINVSSEAHRIAKPDRHDLQASRSYRPLKVYGNVKLFNILFTKSLAERYGKEGLYAFALHPGMVQTNFGSSFSGMVKWGMKLIKPLLISPKEGARTTVFLATADSVLAHNGGFFRKKKLTQPSSLACSKEWQDLLWEESEKLIASYCSRASGK